jgi:hypothetical protein
MNLRFSLLGLIGLTTFAGLASAALVQPSIGWASVIVSLTGAMLCWQVLRVILTAGESRAAAIGWLLFAIGYLAIVMGPWLSTYLGPSLLSSRGLVYAQVQWHKLPIDSGNPQAIQLYDWNGRININSINGIDIDSTSNTILMDSGWISYPAGSGVAESATAAHHFHLAGHWLFAWVAGWLGGLVAVQLQRYQSIRRALVTS